MLLHENTQAHQSLHMQHWLTKHGKVVLPNLPWSPDLAPCDFYLFLRLKDHLKDCHFKDSAKIRLALKIVYGGYQKWFKLLYECWQKFFNCWSTVFWRQLSQRSSLFWHTWDMVPILESFVYRKLKSFTYTHFSYITMIRKSSILQYLF